MCTIIKRIQRLLQYDNVNIHLDMWVYVLLVLLRCKDKIIGEKTSSWVVVTNRVDCPLLKEKKQFRHLFISFWVSLMVPNIFYTLIPKRRIQEPCRARWQPAPPRTEYKKRTLIIHVVDSKIYTVESGETKRNAETEEESNKDKNDIKPK